LTTATAYGPDLRGELYAPQILANALNQASDRPLIQMVGGETYSVAQVRDRVSACVQALRKLGVGKGDRIAILSTNRVEVVIVGLAAQVMAACMVALHPLGAVDDYEYIIRDFGIGAVVFDPTKMIPRAEALAERFGESLRLLSFGPAPLGADLTALWAKETPGPLAAAVVEAGEPARFSYTGGTTGRPKGIWSDYRSGQAMQAMMLADWEWPTVPRTLVCAPLSHTGAALLGPTLLRGGTLFVLPGFEPGAVLQAIQECRINCVLLVPTMIYALLDHPKRDAFDLSSLETVFYGASLMSPARLREAILEFGPVFAQFYGQGEAPMTVTYLRRDEHLIDDPERLASCGRPTPFCHVALLDDENRPVPDGEPGEVCVRGPLVMCGYHNRPEETAAAFAGDWLHTGDVAIRSPDGFLRIVDRKKDMIVTGGFNVYPREVEDVLSGHPAVAQAAVIGVQDAHWGEAVKAVIVLRPGAEASAEALIELVRARKGSVQAPKTVDFVAAIPQTPVGKPDKKALRALYA
jgi:fatty-acyl-CoA synthase